MTAESGSKNDGFLEYLIESDEFTGEEAPGRPIPTYVPPSEGATSDVERAAYFRSAHYPYSHRLGVREYLVQKYDLQVELVKLQNWIKETGGRYLVLLEGRDASGKGNTIKRFTEYLNPRGARVVALQKPTDVECGQWYFQRYVDHLPTRGEIVFFDRSWYNRAGVEKVMGFCTQKQYEDFVQQAPVFEQMLAADGMTIFKFYLSVSKPEQARRFEERSKNPLKQWKLSPIDKEAQARWDQYTTAKEDTMRLTDTALVPWYLVKAEDKLRTRLETMRTVLHRSDYPDKNLDVVREPDPWIVTTAEQVFG